MSSDLQQAIQLAQALSFSEQLELLKALSDIIQQAHSHGMENPLAEEEANFSAESFRTSWQQAMNGQTLPLSELWEGGEDA